MIERVGEHERIPALVNGVARMDQKFRVLGDTLKILISKKHLPKENV